MVSRRFHNTKILLIIIFANLLYKNNSHNSFQETYSPNLIKEIESRFLQIGIFNFYKKLV